MIWDLPYIVSVNGTDMIIRNKCDYRVVLDAIIALNDDELTENEKILTAMQIFYENFEECPDLKYAAEQMMIIINCGERIDSSCANGPQMIDWEHDFSAMIPPINRVIGYSIRDPDRYTHWYDFMGAFGEIGNDCTFSTILTIRSKKMNGKKLEKHEQEFYSKHRQMIDLPLRLSAEERELLEGDW